MTPTLRTTLDINFTTINFDLVIKDKNKLIDLFQATEVYKTSEANKFIENNKPLINNFLLLFKKVYVEAQNKATSNAGDDDYHYLEMVAEDNGINKSVMRNFTNDINRAIENPIKFVEAYKNNNNNLFYRNK
ncbi:MAG: hypothetical protein H0W50_03240 [Parachlamydiaceae bacterium]|nr:hypothetical protein [Parachlamydiaceae bacterium]